MPEHENGPKRNTESERERKPSGKERPKRRGKDREQARKETVYEAGKGAKIVDPKLETREALLRKALENSPLKPGEKRDTGNSLKKLLEFLRMKEKGEKVNEKEEASLLELLLVLLKFLWKQIKEVFQDEEGEFNELFAAAQKAGCRTPQEMMKWMLAAFEFSPDEEKQIDTAFKEAEEGKALGPEEQMKMRGNPEIKGGSGEFSAEEEAEIIRLDYEDVAKRLMSLESEFERLTKSEEDLRKGARPDAIALAHLMGGPLNAVSQRRAELLAALEKAGTYGKPEDVPQDLLNQLRFGYRDLEATRRTLHGILFERESGRGFLSIYGERAVNMMAEIDGYKEDGVYELIAAEPESITPMMVEGVFERLSKRAESKVGSRKDEDKIMADTLASQAKHLTGWIEGYKQIKFGTMAVEGAKRVRGEQVVELRELIRREFLKPMFEKIIGDAEDDPREGFRMESWGFILMSELTDAIRRAGPLGRYEKLMFENELFARRVVHTIHGEAIKRGDPETLLKIGGSLFSEDLDTLMRLEPGLGPARRLVERVLAQARLNPKHDGRIPFDYLSPELGGEYKLPEVESLVASELMEMSKRKSLEDRDGKPITMVREEAERIASLALKVSNLEGRTAEHISMTPLPPKSGEHLISSAQDKLRFDYLRFTGERFEQYGRGREAILPMIRRMNQMVQPGVFEKIPGEAFDQWGINPENFLKIAGTNSASTWRIEEATKMMVEMYDLALGVQLFDREKDKSQIFTKVGDRLPTVVSRYFTTLALKGVVDKEAFQKLPEEVRVAFVVGNKVDYFNLEGRLRDGLLQDKKGFVRYTEQKVEEKIKAGVFGEIRSELLADIESKLVSYKGGKAAADTALKAVNNLDDIQNAPPALRAELEKRLADRRKVLKLQIGAQTAFLGVVAEENGISFKDPDWEAAAWDKWDALQKKLVVLEERALREHVTKVDQGEEKRDEYTKSVLDLAREEGYTEQELRVVERLTNLGGKNKEERGEGVARLADVEFSFTPFTEDILHEKAEWKKIGPPGITRRYNDILMATKGAEIMWQISNGLAGQQDKTIATRKDLTKALVEFQNTLGYLSESDRQKVTAAFTHQIIENLFKADAWWLNIPLIGPMLDMEWPWGSMLASSRAQRKYGLQALSMTALERWRFIQDMRPFVGNQWADQLEKLLKARRRDALFQVTMQWGLPATAYLGWQWVLGPAIKQLGSYVFEGLGQQ